MALNLRCVSLCILVAGVAWACARGPAPDPSPGPAWLHGSADTRFAQV